MKDPKKQKQKTYNRRKNSYGKNIAKQYNLLSQIDQVNSKINDLKLSVMIDRLELTGRLFSDSFFGAAASIGSLLIMSAEATGYVETLNMSGDKIEENPILMLVPILSLIAGATQGDLLYGKIWASKSYSEIFDNLKYNRELKKQKNELTKKYASKYVDSDLNEYVKVKYK